MIEILDEYISLTAADVSYIIRAEKDRIVSVYWGAAIKLEDAVSIDFAGRWSSFDPEEKAYRQEYDVYNGRSFLTPCIYVDSPSDRLNYMEFSRLETTGSEVKLYYDIRPSGLLLEVRYGIYANGVVWRKASVSASERTCLSSFYSGSACLHSYDQMTAIYTTGRWNGEWQVTSHDIAPGCFQLDSRQGFTSETFNPSVMVMDKNCSESQGRVYSLMLAYSGNWEIKIEHTLTGITRMVAGLSSFDNSIVVNKGETVSTPLMYLAYTDKGFGEMSRLLHDFENENVIRKRPYCPVLYNSWEATGFNVTAAGQKELACKAAEIGCELFVVDDGWFSQRNSDRAGLGDWYVNPEKFPEGLDDLIRYVEKLGMKFGIWVEPESVNPDSDLYRAHPDWIYRSENAEPLQCRNQYLLNLCLPEVREYILSWMRRLLSRHNISYIKWDMNRNMSDPDSVFFDGDSRMIWKKHADALYSLWKDITEEFPDVYFESCAGGGGRVDLGIMRYAHQFWTSDNTDAFDRLRIQYGCSLFYSPRAMMCWVTDNNRDSGRAARSLEYRFHCAMCGGLGIGADISRFSAQELEVCKTMIGRYKSVRHLISGGLLYRQGNPFTDNVVSFEYVSKDRKEAVIFTFLHSQNFGMPLPNIRFEGLCNDKRYKLDDGCAHYGSFLRSVGIPNKLKGDFASCMHHAELVECK